ncbi:MAG: hypothetical protein J6A01_04310 [Proteobacteria bacterium]|nr:hypothetical protein [Pseudomonadota bacterium]
MKKYVLHYSGWDTNKDECISKKEADEVTLIPPPGIGELYPINTREIETVSDLNSFKNLTYLGAQHNIHYCNQLQTVVLKNIQVLESASLLGNYNIKTLVLPNANHFEFFFLEGSPNLEHLFLTAPGDFDYQPLSFLTMTADLAVSPYLGDGDSNKNVTLYLSRDKLAGASPKIISPNEWGCYTEYGCDVIFNPYYRWKAIYVCDDYATDISSCELVKE